LSTRAANMDGVGVAGDDIAVSVAVIRRGADGMHDVKGIIHKGTTCWSTLRAQT
jgi:hypothetical protein